MRPPVLVDVDDMAPDLILVVAGLSAAWVVFSIVGGERERVLQKVELDRRAAQTAENDEPGRSSATPQKKDPRPAAKA